MENAAQVCIGALDAERWCGSAQVVERKMSSSWALRTRKGYINPGLVWDCELVLAE